MRLIVLLYFLPILALGQDVLDGAQPKAKLSYYVDLYSHADQATISSSQDILSFANKLQSKRQARNEKQFLHTLFVKTHQRYLKTFEDYASFSELVNNGSYNCLSGTALYALLLDHFGFEFKIIETNYHIFLLTSTNEGKVLFEATDPIHGFVDNENEIEKKLSGYKDQNTTVHASANNKTYYKYSVEIYNEIELDEMLGLFHYNLAIEAFNTHQLQSAVAHLDQANTLYHSPRIEEFSRLVLLSVLESKMEASAKENCVRKIQSIRKRQVNVIASAN
ncbi:MAG: hypothetical protein ACOYXT_07770 [Bacteroidota bacterium]